MVYCLPELFVSLLRYDKMNSQGIEMAVLKCPGEHISDVGQKLLTFLHSYISNDPHHYFPHPIVSFLCNHRPFSRECLEEIMCLGAFFPLPFFIPASLIFGSRLSSVAQKPVSPFLLMMDFTSAKSTFPITF